LKNQLSISFLKVVSILLVTVLAISIILIAAAYRVEPYRVLEKETRYIDIDGKGSFTIRVKPSIVYDNASAISSSKAFLSLTEGVQYFLLAKVYLYNDTEHGGVDGLECMVSNSSVLEASVWRKEIPSDTTVLCDPGNIVIDGFLNVTTIMYTASLIDRETLTTSFRLNYIINPGIIYKVRYSDGYIATYSYNPVISITMDKSSNTLEASASNTSFSKAYTSKILMENSMHPPLQYVKVNTVRVITLYVTPLTAVASAATLYVSIAPGRRRHKDVTGLPVAILDESMFKVVKVDDMSILGRLAKRGYGIIARDPHGSKVYLITDTGIVYVYEVSGGE